MLKGGCRRLYPLDATALIGSASATTEAIKNRLLLRSPLAHSQGQQQHPLEAHLAILGGIPFSLCMRPAAVSSSAQRKSRHAKRERNIGVC